MLWKRFYISNQSFFFSLTPQLVPDIVGLGKGELEVIAKREGLDELVHGGGATLGHPVVDHGDDIGTNCSGQDQQHLYKPVVDQHQTIRCSVGCGGNNVVFNFLMKKDLCMKCEN